MLLHFQWQIYLFQAAEGTGLAFIVFTQAIVELPGAPFWAVIFFMMLLSLGIGSQIGILEGMLCTVFDIEILKRISKEYITGITIHLLFQLFFVQQFEYFQMMINSGVQQNVTNPIGDVVLHSTDFLMSNIKQSAIYRSFSEIFMYFVNKILLLLCSPESKASSYIQLPGKLLAA